MLQHLLMITGTFILYALLCIRSSGWHALYIYMQLFTKSCNLRGTNTCFCFKLIKFQSKFYGNTYAPTLFYYMTICITTDIISHCLSISQHIYFFKRQMREHRRKSTVCLASLRCTSRNVKKAEASVGFWRRWDT